MNPQETRQSIEYFVDRVNELNDQIKQLEQKAKAFELINEKRVDINVLHWAYPSCKAYNMAIKELKHTLFSKELTPEEFEFLGKLAGAE